VTTTTTECAPTEHEWGWIVGPVAPRGMLTRMTCVCQTCGAVYADPAAAMDVAREMFEIDHEEEAGQ